MKYVPQKLPNALLCNYIGVAVLLGLFAVPTVVLALSDTAENKNEIAISSLNKRGIISGYSDGTFRPNNAINRAELLKILVGGTGAQPTVEKYSNCFPDVTNEWFAPFVCYAKENGWVGGYPDGSFKPSKVVNKVEAIKMLVNSQGYETNDSQAEIPYNDVGKSDWYAPFVAAAWHRGLLEEEGGQVGASSDMTRGSISENIYRAIIIREKKLSRFEAHSNQSSTKTVPTNIYCTASAWVCGGWSICNPKSGIQTRECELVDRECKGSEKVNPVESKGCMKGRTPESMVEFVNYGGDLLRDMEVTAYMVITTYAQQILDIMRRYEVDLERYTAITYNVLVDKRWMQESQSDIELIERQLEALEAEYQRIDKVFRRPSGTGYQDELLPLPSQNREVTCEDLKRSINVYKRWDDAEYIRRALVVTGCMLKEDYCRMYGVCEN